MTPRRYVQGAAFLLAGLRRRHGFADAATRMAAHWADLRGLALPACDPAVAYGAVCGHDAQGFDYLAGREVTSFDGLAAGGGRMRVPAQQYAVFVHDRAVDTLADSRRAVFAWLAASPWQSAEGPDFERYGAGFDAVRGRGEIEVWLGIVPRADAAR